MFHKILVALDRSSMGQQVFDQALAIAKGSGATLILLNVLTPEEEECPHMPVLINSSPSDFHHSVLETYQELWHNYEEKGLEMLRLRTQVAIEAGIPTEFTQHLGSPGRVICKVAQDLGIDLIILGRRGYGGLNELFLGSTSNYVIHHAGCSVLVVQPCVQPVDNREPDQQVTVPS